MTHERKLLLLRHGPTEANERHLYCGHTDLPLSENGRKRVNALREAGGYPCIAGFSVYTSGMRRTEETLQLLYGSVPHRAEPDLMEMHFGIFEMKSYEDLKNTEIYQMWITGNNVEKPTPGGESGLEMGTRVLRGFHRILRDTSGDVCIVSHGGTVAVIMSELFPGEGKSRYEWQPAGGEGWLVTLDENGTPVSYQKIPKV